MLSVSLIFVSPYKEAYPLWGFSEEVRPLWKDKIFEEYSDRS